MKYMTTPSTTPASPRHHLTLSSPELPRSDDVMCMCTVAGREKWQTQVHLHSLRGHSLCCMRSYTDKALAGGKGPPTASATVGVRNSVVRAEEGSPGCSCRPASTDASTPSSAPLQRARSVIDRATPCRLGDSSSLLFESDCLDRGAPYRQPFCRRQRLGWRNRRACS